MPADKGVRLDDRQRIANSRDQPIETNEYHSVDGAEEEFLWSSSPQNVDLLPQRPNLCLKHYPRPDQIDDHPTNEPAKIPHCARSSSDSRSTAKQDKVCDRDNGLKSSTERGPLSFSSVCPPWVIFRLRAASQPGPLIPQQRTWDDCIGRDAKRRPGPG